MADPAELKTLAEVADESEKEPGIRFFFRDRNQLMCQEWAKAFAGVPGIKVSCGDIFAGDVADALVSPANSFGFMDGGIDQVYTDRFGKQLQERLQRVIRQSHHGELPVGQAQIVKTGEGPEGFPYLISAPTMRVPMNVQGSVNAFLAFRATLRVVMLHNNAVQKLKELGKEREDFTLIRSVMCPGLGTAIGRMLPEICAKQMRHAYDQVTEQVQFPKALSMAASIDHQLRGFV